MNSETSKSSNRIATLYQRSVLDPIVEIATAIAHDFVQRPRHYKAVTEETATLLESFRIRTGCDPQWPSTKQRSDSFGPIFDDAFRSTCAELRAAAVAVVERCNESSTELLEIRVSEAAAAMRENLKAIDGRVVATADKETSAVFASAVHVLRDASVASVFGLAPAPRSGNWPLEAPTKDAANSSDGAFLVEELQLALGLFGRKLYDNRPAITRHLFVVLQRIAHYGALTIAGTLGEDDCSVLIRNAYIWEKAINLSASFAPKSLEPRVVSREALQDEELTSLPTEEGVRSAAIGGGGGGGPKTCLTGWTRVCDTGPSCTYGWTFRCDTGPTCTSGWTIVCDSGPTCTYGWTFKCDIHRSF